MRWKPLQLSRKMPRTRGAGKRPTERFNIRMDEDTARFYRTKANEHGISLSLYLRFGARRDCWKRAGNRATASERCRLNPPQQRRGQGDGSMPIPEEFLLSVFTSEAMQKARMQKLYEAQDSAKAKLQRIRAGWRGKTREQKGSTIITVV